MAVASVSQWRVTPGRTQEAHAPFSEAKQMHERLGAGVRLYNAFAAGPNTSIRSYVIEVADLEAWGRVSQAMTTDAEWLAYLPMLFGADSPVTLVSNSVLNEVSN